MKTERQDYRFAWHALCVFFGWGGWILIVRVARQSKLIGDLTEGLLRLIPFVLAFGILIWLSRRSRLSMPIRAAFLTLLVTVTVLLTLGLTEDIRMLDDVPIIGQNSAARPGIEYFLNGAWLACTFVLFYLTVRSLVRTSQELESTLVKLRDAQQQSIQRERITALGEMASGVAHDLNNTLTPVVTYTELLMQEPGLTEKQLRLCRCALQSATDAAAVIRRLGDFYRGDSDTASHSAVNIRKLMTQIPLLTRPKWRDEAQLSGRMIDIKLELDDDPCVWGNAAELRTVLTNLVFNAVDAMPEGGIITLGLSADNGHATIRVADTGTGMTQDQIARCFDPFYSTKTEKSGLGLSVCHGIVRQHGGTIEMTSDQQSGTVVRVTLPTSELEGDDSAAGAAGSGPGFALRCLYIEDDEQVRDAFASILRAFGAHVDLADGGAMGLERLESHEYDLVFTDLGMSQMDGTEVLGTIKQRYPDLPVILLSGWPRHEVLARMSEGAPPDEVLEKPVRARDVYKLLESYSTSKSS